MADEDLIADLQSQLCSLQNQVKVFLLSPISPPHRTRGRECEAEASSLRLPVPEYSRGTDHYSTIMHHLPRRYVALEVMYFGKSLNHSELLAKGVSKYSRCDRTDKGVSAVGQVIYLYLRSNCKEITENDATFAGF
ncbi:hypothetical protein AKJ16_DCAP13237 [Drosera capensis]